MPPILTGFDSGDDRRDLPLPAPPKQTCVRCTVPGFGEGAVARLGTPGLEPGSFLTVTVVCECVMPKTELDGLPVIEVPDTEAITVAVKPADMQEGDLNDPEQHPIAIALRRQSDIDDARVSKREVMIRRGDQWFRYGAPKRVS